MLDKLEKFRNIDCLNSKIKDFLRNPYCWSILTILYKGRLCVQHENTKKETHAEKYVHCDFRFGDCSTYPGVIGTLLLTVNN